MPIQNDTLDTGGGILAALLRRMQQGSVGQGVPMLKDAPVTTYTPGDTSWAGSAGGGQITGGPQAPKYPIMGSGPVEGQQPVEAPAATYHPNDQIRADMPPIDTAPKPIIGPMSTTGFLGASTPFPGQFQDHPAQQGSGVFPAMMRAIAGSVSVRMTNGNILQVPSQSLPFYKAIGATVVDQSTL